jgi:hypothetical protein
MKLALLESELKKKCSDRELKKGEEMALVLKGGEFVATEALSASTLSKLMSLASRKPLLINGLELHHQDLAMLAEEAQRTGQPVWPRTSDKLQFVGGFA